MVNIPGKMIQSDEGTYRMVGGKTKMTPSPERYSDVFIDSKYIYGVYTCRENAIMINRDNKAYIHVFDRKGKPIKAFLLDVDVNFPVYLSIESESGTAYGHNTKIDFDYVKTFDMGSRLP